ncbi:MAG: amidohydrolase family protein, partial [Verrucomicrobiota bacterium]|nr:amidohydrolase family protein [Verrucomicrobiota bacterium]
KNTSASLPEAVLMGSLTPARRVGMDSQIGSLEAAKQADFLILDEDLKVRQVFIAGEALSAD